MTAKLDINRETPRRSRVPERLSVGQMARRRLRIARRVSFRTSLTFWVALLVIATGVTLTAFAFRSSHANTAVLTDALFRQVTSHAVTQSRDFVTRVSPVARSLSALGERGLDLQDTDRLAGQLAALLRVNKGVTWISFSDETGTFTGAFRTLSGSIRINQSHIAGDHTVLTEHDVAEDGTLRPYRRKNDGKYDPRKRGFYQQARAAKKLVWLPPYIFYEQSVPGVTCADPLYDAGGNFLGVLTFDFDLNSLNAFVEGCQVSPNSKVILLTTDGVLLARPAHRITPTENQGAKGKLPTVADADDPAFKAFFGQLRPTDTAAGVDRRYRQFEFESAGVPYFAAVQSFQLEDGPVWIVGAMAPKSDFLAGVHRNNVASMLIAAAAVLLAALLAGVLARRVSGPVVKLAKVMHRIGSGDFDARATLGGNREFHQLAAALNQMTDDLREGTRVRHAMALASEVQREWLPPGPPSVPGLDFAGHTTCCDETGGDYYDYLVLGDPEASGGTMIAIGDVAGHGIAAALLMATARGIVRSRARETGNCLAQILTHLNATLAGDLRSGRFMTLCLTVIDPAAGVVRWASAGHDPALVYDPEADSFQELDAGGVPLGVDDDVHYHEHSYSGLRDGCIITLGTDGIWETNNGRGSWFGKERLKDVIRRAAGGSAQDISDAIQYELETFRGSARQRDDVTFVVVKLVPVNVDREETIEAELISAVV